MAMSTIENGEALGDEESETPGVADGLADHGLEEGHVDGVDGEIVELAEGELF